MPVSSGFLLGIGVIGFQNNNRNTPFGASRSITISDFDRTRGSEPQNTNQTTSDIQIF